MKSFKQFINQDSETDPYLDLPIRIKASYFNPASRVQVVMFQHVALDNNKRKANETDQNKPDKTSLHR